MGIEQRIETLERRTGPNGPTILLVVNDGQPEPTEVGKEAALEVYKATHPDWRRHRIIILDMEA